MTASRAGGAIIGTMAALTVAVAIILTVLCAQSLALADQGQQRVELAAAWADTDDFAVLFPTVLGDDGEEALSFRSAVKTAEAGPLYTELTAAGALYVDASNYRPNLPEDDQPLPAAPIRVNTNYLARYPVLDPAGAPIAVSEEETDWVVAVPDRYRSQEEEIRRTLTNMRAERGPGPAGAPHPEQQGAQAIRIVWTGSAQRIFSFDTEVNPQDGNSIVDPIIEIMTPANSHPADRLNAVTGELNTPLKVWVDGAPDGTAQKLAPILQRLGLSDNLPHLVTVGDTITQDVQALQQGVFWTRVIAAAAALVMLIFSAALVTLSDDRLRRTITIRRLNGLGIVRTYRELLTLFGITWAATALGSLVVCALLRVAQHRAGPESGGWYGDVPVIAAVLVLTALAELLCAAIIALRGERRSTATALKEL